MIQHLPDLTRPETDIERIIREIEPKSPDEQPMLVPLQVPGFRDPNDPRIPTALRQAAQARAQQREHKRRRRAR